MPPPPPRSPAAAVAMFGPASLAESGALCCPPAVVPTSATDSTSSLPATPKVGSPTGGTSPAIRTIVDKAKRIAGQIWILLHARGCTSPNCQLTNCRQTKMLYRLARAHQHQGVSLTRAQEESILKARKLLRHYQDCRVARLSSTPKSPHYCLVCSLVARARMAPEDDKANRLRLDFSTAPPADSAGPLLHAVIHRHNTRNAGRRPRSRSWGSGSDAADYSPTVRRAKPGALSSGTTVTPTRRGGGGASGDRKVSGSRRKRSNSLSSIDEAQVQPQDEDESLQLGASLLSVLSASRLPVPAPSSSIAEACGSRDGAGGETGQDLKAPSLKRARSASWGGEWAADRNTATDILSEDCTRIACSTSLASLVEAAEQGLGDQPPRHNLPSPAPSGSPMATLADAASNRVGALQRPPLPLVARASKPEDGGEAVMSLLQLADAVNHIAPTSPQSGSIRRPPRPPVTRRSTIEAC